MKKLCLLVALAMLMAAVAAVAETPATPIYDCGGYTYILLGDDAQIVSWDGPDRVVDVPSSLDGHRVVSVSEHAFADCAELAEVRLPDTVVEIGDGAFADCVNLMAVTLPAGLTRLGSVAFDGCEGLTRITLPASLAIVGDNPFRGCANLYAIDVAADSAELCVMDGALISRTDSRLVCYPQGLTTADYAVPEGIRTIGAMAFDRDLYLERISLPETLVGIGDRAFDGCEALRTMNLPAGVSVIGEDAMRCSNLSLTVEGSSALLAEAVELAADEA